MGFITMMVNVYADPTLTPYVLKLWKQRRLAGKETTRWETYIGMVEADIINPDGTPTDAGLENYLPFFKAVE